MLHRSREQGFHVCKPTVRAAQGLSGRGRAAEQADITHPQAVVGPSSELKRLKSTQETDLMDSPGRIDRTEDAGPQDEQYDEQYDCNSKHAITRLHAACARGGIHVTRPHVRLPGDAPAAA